MCLPPSSQAPTNASTTPQAPPCPRNVAARQIRYNRCMTHLLRIYWFALLATLAIWGATGLFLGWQALFTVIVLTLLEATFSADNAVVNSKVLVTMSPFWQKLFMTVGIF